MIKKFNSYFTCLRNFFNKRMDEEIYCPKCGEKTKAEFYKCSNCNTFIKNPMIQIFSLLIFIVNSFALYFYLWKILPALETIHQKFGGKSLSIFHLNFSMINFIFRFWWLIVPLIVFACYLIIILKPKSTMGANILLFISILFSFFVVFFLITSHINFAINLPQFIK